MSLTKSGVATKKLSIKGKYNEFSDFYDVNKVVIYKNILKLFKELKNKGLQFHRKLKALINAIKLVCS